MTILSVADVAARLRCTEETVREHTPHDLPGVKFGRDWVYVEADVIAAVSRLALQIQKANSPGFVPDIPKPTARRGRRKPLPELSSQV